MTNDTIQTTVEILGKAYPIRCTESERQSLEEAALLLNQKMTEMKESGKAINLERIAIITALNMAHQLLQLDRQKNSTSHHLHQRLSRLQEVLDEAIHRSQQTELVTD
jgi:cell division protein ZapA